MVVSANEPIAHPLLLDITVMSERLLWVVPGGSALGTILHAEPSQCSTNATPVEELSVPTAQTSFVAAASTRAKRLPEGELGLGTMLHWVPFQCSTSVWYGPGELPVLPTAHASLLAMAVTPWRVFDDVP